MLGVACCGLGVGLISPRPFDDEFSAGQPKLDQAPGARREARWQATEPCGALQCSATQGTCGTGRTGQYGWSHDCSGLAFHCMSKQAWVILSLLGTIRGGLERRTSTCYLVSNILGFNCTCFSQLVSDVSEHGDSSKSRFLYKPLDKTLSCMEAKATMAARYWDTTR